jgi:hypothetical protein
MSDKVFDCLCMINECIDLETMRFIDSLPAEWSPTWQKRTLDLILRDAKVICEVKHKNQTQGSRQLCENHVRELAREVGLQLKGSSYEVLLSRLAYIASNISSCEEFELKILHDPKSGEWFCDQKQRAELLHYKNSLYP